MSDRKAKSSESVLPLGVDPTRSKKPMAVFAVMYALWFLFLVIMAVLQNQ